MNIVLWLSLISNEIILFTGITKFHHFNFGEGNSVICKEFVDSEEETFQLSLTANMPSTSSKSDAQFSNDSRVLPELLEPQGLSLDRQWYLFDSIRSLCSDPEKVDLVAPQPLLDKSKKSRSLKDSAGPSNSRELRKRKLVSKK